jgi:hypothetical protein
MNISVRSSGAEDVLDEIVYEEGATEADDLPIERLDISMPDEEQKILPRIFAEAQEQAPAPYLTENEWTCSECRFVNIMKDKVCL